jgi:hypothetical protein
MAWHKGHVAEPAEGQGGLWPVGLAMQADSTRSRGVGVVAGAVGWLPGSDAAPAVDGDVGRRARPA